MSCDGCKMTFDIAGQVLVPLGGNGGGGVGPGGNYFLSGILMTGLGPDSPSTGLPVRVVPNTPSGSRWVIYDPESEDAISFPAISVAAYNGSCYKPQQDCVEQDKCLANGVYIHSSTNILEDGDIGFRINGGEVQHAQEQGVDWGEPGHPVIDYIFSMPLSTKMACGGEDVVVQLEYTPNNTWPLPAGYDNWATGMTITFHCGKCVDTEEPIE
jgi:hypothetical protein